MVDAAAGAAERRMIVNEVKDYPSYLDYPKPHKVQTTLNRTRSMTDEELAECLYEIGYDGGWFTPKGTLEWHQQPAEEG